MKKTHQLLFEGHKFTVEDVTGDANAQAFADRTKNQLWIELDEPERIIKLKAVYDACVAAKTPAVPLAPEQPQLPPKDNKETKGK